MEQTTYNVQEFQSTRNNEMGALKAINEHLQAAIKVAEMENSFALNPLLRFKLDLSRQAHTARLQRDEGWHRERFPRAELH